MRSIKHVVKSASKYQVDSLAKKLGGALKGGEVIELVGDIGAGKTFFAKSLVIGAGFDAHVTSPTFVVKQVYESSANQFMVYHYDFYRIDNPGIIINEIKEALSSGNVLIIEWARTIASVLPDQRLVIQLTATSDDSARDVELQIPEQLKYLDPLT